MKIIFDVKCNACSYQAEDYDEPGLESYGSCPHCEKGTMHRVFSAPKTIIMTPSATGRTTNGMKWSVDPKPRQYDPKTGKFGSRV